MFEVSIHDQELARTAAVEAGHCLRAFSDQWQGVIGQATHDIKLEADQKAESIILGLLKQNSKHAILSEECGETGGAATEDGLRWIVDPLDGTANYARGAPFASVSIALWQGTQPLYGVVYDFWREELFYGGRQQGAFLNDRPIHVSDVVKPSQATLSTGFPANRDFSEKALLPFLGLVQRFKKIRLFGSTALALAYVACGRADAYLEDGIMLWDIAAGMAIVEGAGGETAMKPVPGQLHTCYAYAAACNSLQPDPERFGINYAKSS